MRQRARAVGVELESDQVVGARLAPIDCSHFQPATVRIANDAESREHNKRAADDQQSVGVFDDAFGLAESLAGHRFSKENDVGLETAAAALAVRDPKATVGAFIQF